MLAKASASSVFTQQNIFLTVCSLAARRGRDRWRRPVSGTRSTKAVWSGIGKIFPSCVKVKQWPIMKGESLSVSFPLPQLDLLSLWLSFLRIMKDGKTEGIFPSFWSLMQMTALKERAAEGQPAADGLCLVVPELILVSSSELLGLIMHGVEKASFKLSKSTC